MMKNNEKKKGNNAKKILPAAGMLALSASMLATSTYAWFTMSREVEVKNIQMTASVPEDLQISLGKLTDIKGQGSSNPNATEISAGSYTGLQGNQGRLLGTTSADDGGVDAPANDGTAIDNLFWSNTADISEYYRLGKIIPASSIDGKGIFFTPDASGVGTTLKAGAKFYQAASLASSDFSTIFKWDSTSLTYATDGTGDEARTKLHAITNVDASADVWNSGAVEGGTNTYDGADAWNDTNDDGYYVDIPIWIRSSAKDDTALSVDAYVTTNAAKTNNGSEANDDELYLAARAAIIYGSGESANSTNLLRIRKDSLTNTKSIIDYMYTTNSSGDAVASVASYDPTYGDAVEYNGSAFLTVPGRDETSTAKYGTMVKAVVRVWLEGEDPNCWNPNAGQDFNISLKFVKGAIGDTTEVANNANGILYPAAYAKGTAADADVVDVVNGTKVTITSTTKNGDTNGTLEFTYDGNKWNQTGGSFEVLDGWTYQITGTGKTAGTVTGADGIATWLKNNVTKQADVANTVTYSITETDTNAAVTP